MQPRLRAVATTAPPAPDAARPLAVDLDGTLARTDLLFELIAVALRKAPLFLLRLPFIYLFSGGAAAVKRALAERVDLDHGALPLREDLVAWLREERAKGRMLLLVTASDSRVARAVHARLGLFLECFGSDGVRNLKGAEKRRFLDARFPQGWAYAGDSAPDRAVWRGAASAVLAGRGVRFEKELAAAGVVVEARFPDQTRTTRAWIGALRLHQWAKNALIFAPMLLAHQFGSVGAWMDCALAFFLLGAVASGGYLVNDIADLAADRAHWSKKERPLASGQIPLSAAMTTAPVLTIGGVALGFLLNPLFGVALAAYLALTLLYTFHLKRIAMVDTATLATLFTLRIVMGVPLVGAEATPWLLAFSMTLFLSLSLAKRHAELLRKAARDPNSAVAGRGYAVADSDLTLAMGVSTAMVAIVVLMLYVMGEAASEAYRAPAWLWATPLILYLWLSRIWLKCHRGVLHDDPVVFALRDRLSLALAACAAAAFAGATWGPP